jgi:hypothetical protein
VGHPIPPQAPVAGRSSGADHRGNSPLQIAWTLDVSEEESDDGTDVDAYLNIAMFSTQPVRILLLPI